MHRHFVSFPKSGRSWIRYILSQLGLADRILFHHDGFEFNNGTRPPHEFNRERRIHYYQAVDRIVYLDRDPRDVMVSLFHQITGRFQDFYEYNEPLSSFIRDPYFGGEVLQRFRAMWHELIPQLPVEHVTYEDCHANMPHVMRRILDHYQFEVSDSDLDEAIRNAEFSKMKKLEQSETFQQPWLRPRNGAPKVRSGKVGSFSAELDDKDVEFLNKLFDLHDVPHSGKSEL